MVEYKVFQDQGGNIGIYCPYCGSCHWKEDHETLDYSTNKDCINCVDLKKNTVFAKEKSKQIKKKSQPASLT